MQVATRWRWLSILLLLLLTLPILYTPAEQLLSFSIVPDTAEYACAAKRFADEGKFSISVSGVDRPSRYEPFFPVVGLSWIFKLTHNLSALRFVMLGYALGAILAAYLIGNEIAGTRGAWCAAFFLLTYGLFRSLAQLVLSDVPSVTFVLFALAWYLVLRRRNHLTIYNFLAAGLLALGAGFRFPDVIVLLPFLFLLRRAKCPAICAAALLLPVVALFTATTWFNSHVFGSFHRNGYEYWMPVPYEFPHLLFGFSYVAENFKYCMLDANCAAILAALLAVLWLVERKEKISGITPFGAALQFCIVSSVPISLFYFFYFFPSSRFYLPLGALFVVMLGAGGGKLFALHRIKTAYVTAGCASIIAALSAAALFIPVAPLSDRLAEISAVKNNTPPDSFIITALDPVYTWCIDGDSSRTYFPISRRVEYASKMIAPQPLSSTAESPAVWSDHRWPKLLELGGTEAVPTVATEGLKPVYEALAQNRPVFADLLSMSMSERNFLAGFFSLEPIVRGLVRLSPPHIVKP